MRTWFVSLGSSAGPVSRISGATPLRRLLRRTRGGVCRLQGRKGAGLGHGGLWMLMTILDMPRVARAGKKREHYGG